MWYAMKQMEYLIRDAHFTLKIDHKNLLYMNDRADPKIKRWKLSIQEYDFEVEHIEGKNNIVADALSRLCGMMIIDEDEKPVDTSPERLMIMKEFKLTKAIHDKISKVHNSKVGHHGVDRTCEMISKSEKEKIDNLRQYVKLFILKCPCCQKMRDNFSVKNTTPFTVSTFSPMERLSIDTIGPLPRSADGNRHVVVIVDNFTRWVELFPIADLTMKTAAKCLLEHIGRFGSPSQLLSDNGSQFVNSIIKEVCDMIDTEHIRGMAYSKEENAIVERMNKEVGRHLRSMIYHDNVIDKWDSYLPFVQRIINATKIESIGVPPAHILFGKAIDLDHGFIVPLYKSERHDVDLDEYSKELIEKQSTIIQVAKETLHKRDEAYMTKHLGARVTEFPVNSLVLLRYPKGMGGQRRAPSKLHPKLKGPYKVLSFSGAEYKIRSEGEDDSIITTHIQNLEPFELDELRDESRVVANKDQKMTTIEEIRGHSGKFAKKGKRTKLTNLAFLVKWEGEELMEHDNSGWATWSTLRSTDALHKYLRKIGEARHIPYEFRTE